jgi:hypothetical protein
VKDSTAQATVHTETDVYSDTMTELLRKSTLPITHTVSNSPLSSNPHTRHTYIHTPNTRSSKSPLKQEDSLCSYICPIILNTRDLELEWNLIAIWTLCLRVMIKHINMPSISLRILLSGINTIPMITVIRFLHSPGDSLMICLRIITPLRISSKINVHRSRIAIKRIYIINYQIQSLLITYPQRKGQESLLLEAQICSIYNSQFLISKS